MPEFLGKMPVRTELTVLPADNPSNKPIGFVCYENIGVGIFNPRATTVLNKIRERIILIEYPLLGRQSATIESVFFPNDDTIEVNVYMNKGTNQEARNLVGSINKSGFYPSDHYPKENSPILSDLGVNMLVATIFNSGINLGSGPRYREIELDGFWVKFIEETQQMYAIASIHNI